MRVTPLRFTTLQCSQIGFTLVRTFTGAPDSSERKSLRPDPKSNWGSNLKQGDDLGRVPCRNHSRWVASLAIRRDRGAPGPWPRIGPPPSLPSGPPQRSEPRRPRPPSGSPPVPDRAMPRLLDGPQAPAPPADLQTARESTPLRDRCRRHHVRLRRRGYAALYALQESPGTPGI
jgi:hypothetical protein